MQVRIHFNCDLRGSLQTHVEVEADLGEERQIGPEPGRDEHPGCRSESAPIFGNQHSLPILK